MKEVTAEMIRDWLDHPVTLWYYRQSADMHNKLVDEIVYSDAGEYGTAMLRGRLLELENIRALPSKTIDAYEQRQKVKGD